MRCWSLIAFVWFATLAVAQRSPDHSPSPFSSDLVLWSHMQQPQQPEQDRPHQAPTPTPDPSPETQPPQNPTPSRPGQSTQKSTGSPGPASTAQTFTGIIDKQASNFLLKVSETISYKLDNQTDVQQYEGKRVRITGTLDSSVNLIHVDKVEPLS